MAAGIKPFPSVMESLKKFSVESTPAALRRRKAPGAKHNARSRRSIRSTRSTTCLRSLPARPSEGSGSVERTAYNKVPGQCLCRDEQAQYIFFSSCEYVQEDTGTIGGYIPDIGAHSQLHIDLGGVLVHLVRFFTTPKYSATLDTDCARFSM